jgi:hypothetical protein
MKRASTAVPTRFKANPAYELAAIETLPRTARSATVLEVGGRLAGSATR